MRTFGLIPAAGKSRRMGRAKLVLPLGDKTVLEHVVSAVHTAGVRDVLVVTAPEDRALAELATTSGAVVLRLAEDTPDMRATCLHGLTWLEDHFHATAEDGWLLMPADHPTVRADVVRSVLASGQRDAIVVPTFQGRRGHPTWLSWSHVAAIRSMSAKKGLNEYIRAHQDKVLEIAWPSDEILRDLDTPEDYDRLIKAVMS